MRVGIFGVGALGCLFGARLAKSADVVLFGHWQEQIDRLDRDGLLIKELDGRQTEHKLHATAHLEDLRGIDLAIVLVKSQQTAQTAVEVAQVLSASGIVVTLQNGLGNREKLLASIPPERILIGTTSQGANIPTMGAINHAGDGFTDLEQHDVSDSIARLLNGAGIKTRIQEDVRQVIWGKLTANVGINPLTALLGWNNGALADEAPVRAMMCAAAEEAGMVAQALNVTLPYTSATDAILTVAKATAPNRSSMLQDVTRGAKTEIEAICGEVMRLGEQMGVSVQTNRFLYEAILDGEKRPWKFWSADTLFEAWSTAVGDSH